MRPFVGVLRLVLAFVMATGMLAAQQQPRGSTAPPPWAYGFTAPPNASSVPATPPAPPSKDGTQYKLTGSALAFTAVQIRNEFGPADWYPGDHPPMPELVAKGRRDQQVFACSLCHYPNGKGRPENASVSGLPYSYIVQTMLDFKNDARKSADPRKVNTNRMIAFAKAMTVDEIEAVAAYFSSMKWTPWIRVVETDTVPKRRIDGLMFLVLDGAQAGREPIGERIIEAPENTEQAELRNPRSGFVAYVPPGSIKKGEALVAAGQCTLCHGAALEGRGPVPGIAGRSPSYLVRQLYDMQQGTRKGVWTELMAPVVEKLTAEDMLNIAAYTAARAQAAQSHSDR